MTPSDICGLPTEIFPATLVLGVPTTEASRDSSPTFNNKNRKKREKVSALEFGMKNVEFIV